MLSQKIGPVTARMELGTLILTDSRKPGLEIRLDGEGPRILGEFLAYAPDRGANDRQAFRVPISAASGLVVRLLDSGTVPVVPVSISVTGMFITPIGGGALDFTIGRELAVQLEFEQRTLDLHGIVCRLDRTGAGLLFRESFRNEQVEPPPALTRIVMELQRRAAASRLETAP